MKNLELKLEEIRQLLTVTYADLGVREQNSNDLSFGRGYTQGKRDLIASILDILEPAPRSYDTRVSPSIDCEGFREAYEIIEGLTNRYATRHNDNWRGTGGSSLMLRAFKFLRWEDPHKKG